MNITRISDLEKRVMKLEAELNKIKFHGVPIGGLLANQLTIHLQMGRTIAKTRDIPLLLLKLIKYILFWAPSSSLRAPSSLPKGAPLLTFLSNRRHYRVQIETLIDNYSGAKIGAILFDNRISKLAPKVEQLHLSKGHRRFWKSWFVGWYKILRPAYQNLRSSDLPLSLAEMLQYLNLLTIQTQKITHFQATIRTLSPAWVLTEYDKHAYSVPMIAAAKSLGIPTFSLLHGSITFLQGYIPPVADKLFVWGRMQQEYLLEHGCPAHKLEVAGAPHLSDRPVNKPYKDDTFWVTFATNPHRANIMFGLCTDFISALEVLIPAFPNIRGMIRIHPSENIEHYQANLSIDGKNIIIDDGNQFEFHQSILRSDLVVTYNSAYGLDALLQNKGLIQLAKEPTNDFFTFLVDKIEIPSVKNSQELSQEIRKYIQGITSPLFLAQRKMQREALCLYYEQEAAVNILRLIDSQQKKTSAILN